MKDIEVIPLGTVSPYPKDNCNCPGFLVKYKNYNILLDCGNGITRFLKFPDVLNNLYVIITHMHKDHYGDLSSLEYASYVYKNLNILKNKINVFTPSVVDSIKESYANYHVINKSFMLDDLKISFYDNMSHNIKSYVVILENDLQKIVYTSDIGNTNLDELCCVISKADLLICESSFIKKYNIKNNNHLHAYEAALLAKNSSVDKLMLTHFWPEEDKNNYLLEAKEIFDNTVVAMENKPYVLKRRCL